jgi:hypothetical protein
VQSKRFHEIFWQRLERVSKVISMRRLAQTGLVTGLVLGAVFGLANFGLGKFGLGNFGLVRVAAAQKASPTHISLGAETREAGGHSVATLTATVESEDGTRPTGAVTVYEGDRGVAGAALDAEGKAVIRLDSLTAGDHTLRAVYDGDGGRAGSKSDGVQLHPEATAAADFGLAIAPASLSVKAGNNGKLAATVTPDNGFTGFVSLSCSGLPTGATCTFTPANLQVTSAAAITAEMSLVTTAPAGQEGAIHPPTSGSGASPLALAFVMPGVAVLGFLGRKRNLLGRSALIMLVGVIGTFGMTACAARYRYLNHPPTYNGGTPTGSYTITVTAQTSNGVTAAEHSTTLALTVN